MSNQNVYIIAEAGVNHNGSLQTACQLVDAASDAGADAVKFQTFKAEKLVSKTAPKADYQKQNTDHQESQFDMIKKLELDDDAHKTLIAYCKKRDIDFLSTPFDTDSAAMLHKLGLPLFKIPSGEITNLPYLRTLGGYNKHIILSTGMASIGEVEAAVNILTTAGTAREKIVLLHANTQYPTPIEDVNLLAMETMGAAFSVNYGYSDHTTGIEVPIAAVARGATVIEKHFTLDKNMDGPDHKASLEPYELTSMVRGIRRIEKAMGDGIKRPSKSEKANIAIARKSIIVSCQIKKGEKITKDNITVKRPGTGISPMRWDEIIGSYATKDYNVDDLLMS